MIPISDDNPTINTPWMTYLVLAGIAAVWVLVQGAGFDTYRLMASACNLGMVPAELTGQRPVGFAIPMGRGLACVVDDHAINWLTPAMSMFLHGGWGHILGNALFLWVFGNNIEDSMGPGRFLAFYLVCGLIAAASQVAVQPGSAVPMVGASGAISGIMGAYLVLYPRARVNILFYFLIFFKVIPFRAWVALLWWFGWQLIAALPGIAGPASDVSGGVAVAAHIGGFLAGLLLIKAFADPALLAARRLVLGQRYGQQ